MLKPGTVKEGGNSVLANPDQVPHPSWPVQCNENHHNAHHLNSVQQMRKEQQRWKGKDQYEADPVETPERSLPWLEDPWSGGKHFEFVVGSGSQEVHVQGSPPVTGVLNTSG